MFMKHLGLASALAVTALGIGCTLGGENGGFSSISPAPFPNTDAPSSGDFGPGVSGGRVPSISEDTADCADSATLPACYSFETCDSTAPADIRCASSRSCVDGRTWGTLSHPVCADNSACALGAAALEGQPCTDGPGSICAYPHVACGCVAKTPKGDAGAARSGTYHCVNVPLACPRTRPGRRTQCVRSMTCNYGYGAFTGGVALNCDGSQWVDAHPQSTLFP